MKNLIPICAITLLIVGSTSGEDLPSDVERLVSKRNETVAKINRTMVEELEKLKLKYTKAGDLESANKTVKLIEMYSKETAGSISPKSQFSGVFVSSIGTGYEVKFIPDSIKANVTQTVPGGKTFKGTALLRDDKLELAFEEAGTKATMIHLEGNRFHWFWNNDMRAKPTLMTKQPSGSR